MASQRRQILAQVGSGTEMFRSPTQRLTGIEAGLRACERITDGGVMLARLGLGESRNQFAVKPPSIGNTCPVI